MDDQRSTPSAEFLAFQTLTEERQKTMQEDISEIKESLKKLPEEISKRLGESSELKIMLTKEELRREVQTLKTNFYKWVAGLTFAVISELVSIIIMIVRG